jgi:hypothetical protein
VSMQLHQGCSRQHSHAHTVHISHSIKQCDTKHHTSLMQSNCNITIKHPLPPTKMLLISSTHTVTNGIHGTWTLECT